MGGRISADMAGGSTEAMISCWNYPTTLLMKKIVVLVVNILIGT